MHVTACAFEDCHLNCHGLLEFCIVKPNKNESLTKPNVTVTRHKPFHLEECGNKESSADLSNSSLQYLCKAYPHHGKGQEIS